MAGYLVDPSEEEPDKPWWETNWGLTLIALCLVVCTIIADNYGYGGTAEWAIAFALGTGMAIAAFWKRRSSPWFWPAVVLLIVAHIVALVSYRWRVLPSYPTGTAIQMKGAAGLDFAVSGLFLYVLHLLFDPRTGPKAHWSATAKAAASIFILINLSVFALMGVGLVHAHNNKIAHLRLVLLRETSEPTEQLMECLDYAKTRNEEWDDLGGAQKGKQLMDDLLNRKATILDKGTVRVVQIETVDGRPLRSEEMKLIEGCLT